MSETFWEQVLRFPRWKQHEWLGAAIMLMGLTWTVIGVCLIVTR